MQSIIQYPIIVIINYVQMILGSYNENSVVNECSQEKSETNRDNKASI